MKPEEIIGFLSTPEGREELTRLALDPETHVRLEQFRAHSENSFIRALTAHVLTEAAILAVAKSPQVLSVSGGLAPRAVEVKHRVTPRTHDRQEVLAALQEVWKNHGALPKTAENYISGVRQAYRSDIEDLAFRRDARGWSVLFEDMWGILDGVWKGAQLESMIESARRAFGIFLLEHEEISPIFVRSFLSRTHGEWDSFLLESRAGVGVRAEVAGGKAISPGTWEQLVLSEALEDVLLVATRHPSILNRETAVATVESQVPYFLERRDFYALAEVMDLLPERVAKTLLPSLNSTLRDSWSNDEYWDWHAHLKAWSPDRVGFVHSTGGLEAEKKPRWWGRR